MFSISNIIEQYYVLWVFLAVILGVVFPVLSFFSILSSLFLAIMIASISLTLDIKELRNLSIKSVIVILVLQFILPILGYLIGKSLGLSSPIIYGIVIIGVVTPEFVTPVLTRLSDGNTALSNSILIITGLGSVLTIPFFVQLLIGNSTQVNTQVLILDLLFILILPMSIAVVIKFLKPGLFTKTDQIFSNIATIMLILLITIASASNSSYIRSFDKMLFLILVTVTLMNLFGYLLGFLTGLVLNPKDQITAIYSVGMRDFAVAIALIFSSNLTPIIVLPAVIYGIVEIITSAFLVRFYSGKEI